MKSKISRASKNTIRILFRRFPLDGQRKRLLRTVPKKNLLNRSGAQQATKKKLPRCRRWFWYNKCSCRTKTELESSCLVLCGASGLADLPSVVCRVENTEKEGLGGCLIKFVPHRSKVVFPSVSSPQAFCPAKEVKPVQNCNKFYLLSHRRKLVASSKQYSPVNLVEQRSESKNWI